MKQKNGRLVVLVAAVAVAAVAIGGVLAYRQRPQIEQADAAPLTAPTSAAKTPTATPSPTPTPTPSSTPTSTGPTKIKLNLAKLPQGRAPQVPYLVGREVRGGAGDPVKIPGTDGIIDIGRLDSTVLAVVYGNDKTELLKVGYDAVQRVPDVSSLVTTDDQRSAAYAAARNSSMGVAVKGAIVYAESENGVKQLKMPNSWNVEVLAYVDGKVYFSGGDTDGLVWKLYEWTPGETKAKILKVGSPTAVSDNGRIAASAGLINDNGSCTAITEVTTGKRLWRTCENMVNGFTPDGATAIGGSVRGNDGYCQSAMAALDATTGRLIREWTSCFHQVLAEDDQHFLAVADSSTNGGGDEANGTRWIIRCDVTTGTCETTTPVTTTGSIRIGV